jgi:hypothetical protein
MPQPTIQLGGANATRDTLAARLKARVALLALFVGSMWAVFFVSAAMPFLNLNRHGVVPRTLGGLHGFM